MTRTRTNWLLSGIGLTFLLVAGVGLIAGVDSNLTAVIATVGFVFVMAVYWRERPPGWPGNARW